jgi:hypothetical protein
MTSLLGACLMCTKLMYLFSGSLFIVRNFLLKKRVVPFLGLLLIYILEYDQTYGVNIAFLKAHLTTNFCVLMWLKLCSAI